MSAASPWASVADIAGAVARGDLSATDVTTVALQRAHAAQARFNCFMEIADDAATAAALAIDRAVIAGAPVGPLAGVPVVIKDATPVAGMGNRLGSKAFAEHRATHDAIVVQRLRAAGAVILGTTTLSELASSSFCDSPLHGVTRNPWDPATTPGGSSGGSAVAVAVGCAAIGEGTDMGGSVRIPASFTGLVGIKPSAGRIPNDDMVSLVDDIQHHGLLGRTVADVAAALTAVSGPTLHDPQSFVPDLRPLLADAGVGGRRIAVSDDLGFFVVGDEIRRRLHDVAGALAGEGADVEHVQLGWDRSTADGWVACWHVYLAAFFGDDLDRLGPDCDPKLRAVVDKGRARSAVEIKRLELVRSRQWSALAELWRHHDLLISPTMTRTAVPWDGDDAAYHVATDDGRKQGLDMTSVFNWVPWCPALTVPAGLSASGMPIGIHIAAPPFRDDLVIAAAGAVERVFGVHHPPLADRLDGD